MQLRKLSVLSAAAFALAIGAVANSAHAAIFFLASDLSTAPNSGLTLSPNQSDFGQFTLTAPGTTLTTMAAFMKDAGGGTLALASNFSASIVNDNAGIPGATTILSTTGTTTGTFSTTAYSQFTFTIPSASVIPAGTYWLKITHANVAEDSVLFGDSTTTITNTGDDGTIGQKMYDGTSSSTNFGIFGVTGSPSPVPEPTSLALLAVPALLLLKRRRPTA